MAGCFGGSSYDRYLESQVNDYCDYEDTIELEVTEKQIDRKGNLSVRTYTTYAEDLGSIDFYVGLENRPFLKNGKRSKAKVSHFFPRDGVMLIKVGKFVAAVVKEVD